MVQTEIIRHEFSQRLIKALSAANYPVHGRGIKLARALGVSSKAVSKWLSGEALPRPAMMKALAKTLNVDHLWLQHGDEASNSQKKLITAVFRQDFPLIDWESLQNWKDLINENPLKFKWFATGSLLEGDYGFWLIVKDDLMTSSTGLCVPEKSMILVDPNRTPESGDLVIAKIEGAKKATFRQFFVDQGTNTTYLKPLNSNYKPIEINDSCQFIGVVVESRMSLVPQNFTDAALL